MPRYTNKEFLDAIDGSAGIISTVADRVGCSWDTANQRIKKSDKLTRAFEDEQERVNDFAEQTVLKSIKAGNTQDAKWWLARIRKERFSERQEVTGADGGKLDISLSWGDE